MENFYRGLLNPSKENLHTLSIKYFDPLFDKYPKFAEALIQYINECFNYHSPLFLEGKDWTTFLNERFTANNLPEDLRKAIVDYECKETVFAISDFLDDQHQGVFATIVAKENLKKEMKGKIQDPSVRLDDKRTANNILTEVTEELKLLYEEMRQDQKPIGNYKGYDAVKKAKSIHLVNIANV